MRIIYCLRITSLPFLSIAQRKVIANNFNFLALKSNLLNFLIIFCFSSFINLSFSQKYNVEYYSPSLSTKYILKRVRAVFSNSQNILTVVFGLPKSGLSASHGNHFIEISRNDGRISNLFSEFTNNQSKYNNSYIDMYSLNNGLNDNSKIYFSSRSGSDYIYFNEMVLQEGSNYPQIYNYELPYKIELNSDGIETFKVWSSKIGNGLGGFLGNSTYDGKSYLFIYNYKNNGEIKKIDLVKSCAMITSPSTINSSAAFNFSNKLNGTEIRQYLNSIVGIVENENYIYAFLSGGEMRSILPICINKKDNSVTVKSNSIFQTYPIEESNICGMFFMGYNYLPDLKGFANYYTNYNDSYNVDVFNSKIEKQYTFLVNDINIQTINDHGNYIIIGGYTKSSGYKGYPNPKIIVINKSTKTISFSKVFTKKNACINSIYHDLNEQIIISIGSTTCQGEPETDELFIPELIVDKLNSDGRFKNDLTGVNTEQNYGNNNKKVDSEIFSEIDVDAEFIGGVNALMKFLSENINYPHTSMVNNIQGKVIVAFVVETDGSISNITIKKGITDDLNKEAIRIVSSMPKWKPAEKNGNVVRSKCSLPINFLLN